jgi:hypothetical protein
VTRAAEASAARGATKWPTTWIIVTRSKASGATRVSSDPSITCRPKRRRPYSAICRFGSIPDPDQPASTKALSRNPAAAPTSSMREGWR